MTSHTGWRSSSAFVTLVVCVAIFTDIFLYGLVVPVLPFALKVRIGLPENDIQILGLGLFGYLWRLYLSRVLYVPTTHP